MYLLHVLFLFLNAAHLILSVNEKQFEQMRPTFDEIYGKGWDKDDHQQIKVETSPLNSGENALNEQADHEDNIDQDVEAYNSDSTDQNLTQEDPESIVQSDDETIEGINEENEFSEKEKREIICKFQAIKEKIKKKGKFLSTEWFKIECKIGVKLGVSRDKFYKWKKEFGLSRKIKRNKNDFYEKKKREFVERIEEIKMSQYGEQNKLAKDLGISRDTFLNWKKEFGLPIDSQIKYSESEKLELMGKYSKIKQRNAKVKDIDIANILNIGEATLCRWKKQFVNPIDENSLPKKSHFFADNDTLIHPMASSDYNLWAWNLATKKRSERTKVEFP